MTVVKEKTKTGSVVCDKEILLAALIKMIKFIPKKSIIPILDSFKFSVNKKNNLVITASNGEVTGIINTQVVCDSEISFCIPAGLFLNTVKLFREPELKVVLKSNNKIVVTCGKSKYNISCDDVSEYPELKIPTCQYELSLSSKEFRDGIEVTERFVNTKNNSEPLQGVSLTEKNKEIVFVGTDGNALAKYTSPAKAIKDWSDIIVPHSTAKSIFEMLNDKDIVDIYHNDKNIVAQCSDMTIISTLISAKYPQTDKFFNIIQSSSVILHVMEIKDSLDRLKLYTNKESATITFNILGDKLDITASDSFNNHSGVESISLKEKASSDIIIAFNAELFISILESISEVEFIFGYSANDKMVSINPVPMENEKINKTFVLMPCKI